MFEMTSQQTQAFSDATNGVSALDFNHLILFCIGAFAIIWFLLVFVGTWKALLDKKIDMGDAFARLATGIFVLVATGALIY